jgi:phosphotransferase system  glucose/maltose/N-acetylglucosamine-specific IIC component
MNKLLSFLQDVIFWLCIIIAVLVVIGIIYGVTTQCKDTKPGGPYVYCHNKSDR